MNMSETNLHKSRPVWKLPLCLCFRTESIIHYLYIIFRYLQEQLHFIDKRRLAVWGWSYGGFIATMLLSNTEQKLFNCGVAVAPVVSWKLYG